MICWIFDWLRFRNNCRVSMWHWDIKREKNNIISNVLLCFQKDSTFSFQDVFWFEKIGKLEFLYGYPLILDNQEFFHVIFFIFQSIFNTTFVEMNEKFKKRIINAYEKKQWSKISKLCKEFRTGIQFINKNGSFYYKSSNNNKFS